MFDCNNLVHPFQNDPGCSQSQRVLDVLLNGSAKIDGRTLADLLNYFTELSSHIKFTYAVAADAKGNYGLQESSWESFFLNSSPPFILAAATKNNSDAIDEKFQLYNLLFSKIRRQKGFSCLSLTCTTAPFIRLINYMLLLKTRVYLLLHPL